MEKAIKNISALLKEEFYHESTGHDWFHIERVLANAREICKHERGDENLVILGALFHDIADHKFVENADAVADQRIEEILSNENIDAEVIEKVKHIVRYCSYKGGGKNKMELFEGKIVQDADRLDAIGAIGIARTFAFGGKFGNSLYDPSIKPLSFRSAEEYRNNRTHTINHFYEKLLLLKDLMNTETGRKMAASRHEFMETYLEQFYNEWEGKL